MRKSPLGGQPLTDGTRRVALAKQDPRCRGLFGAAWGLGYISQFTLAGADAITIMSLTGHSGIVARVDENRLIRHPIYFLLKRCCAPARVCSVSVSDPSRIAALALSREGKRELLLANLTGDAVAVVLDGWAASARPSIMDVQSWESFSSVPDAWDAARQSSPFSRLRLEAYAIASLAS
jgi:D-apionolactonase